MRLQVPLQLRFSSPYRLRLIQNAAIDPLRAAFKMRLWRGPKAVFLKHGYRPSLGCIQKTRLNPRTLGFSVAAFYRCFFFFFLFFFLAKSVIPAQNNGQCTTDATNCNQQNNCQHSIVPNQLPANKTSPLPKDCIAQIIYINK